MHNTMTCGFESGEIDLAFRRASQTTGVFVHPGLQQAGGQAESGRCVRVSAL